MKSLFGPGLRQQDHEFFSTVPADYVNLANLSRQERGNLPQDLVTQQMPEAIVQRFELVHVYHDERELIAEAPGALDLLRDASLKVASIKDTRETVEISQLLHPMHVVRVLDCRGKNVCDRFQRLCLGVGEKIRLAAGQNQQAQRLTVGNHGNGNAGLSLFANSALAFMVGKIADGLNSSGIQGMIPPIRVAGKYVALLE